jgi:hypothetical protein
MRTVVISFKDNETAEKFVKHVAFMQGGYLVDGAIEEYDSAEEFVADTLADPTVTTLDAMIARPTMACQCRTVRQPGKMGSTVGNYTLTPHFRWWVHRKCKRPTKYIVKNFIANMIGGHRDLLAEIISSHKEVSDHLVPTDRLEVNQFQVRQSR